jgi:predicted HTH domain antitoxin
MEVTIRVPDELAQRLSADGEVSRQVLEAFALESYGNNNLTLLEVSELLGMGRIETEDFLGRHKVPLAQIDEAELEREAKLFEAVGRRKKG